MKVPSKFALDANVLGDYTGSAYGNSSPKPLCFSCQDKPPSLSLITWFEHIFFHAVQFLTRISIAWEPMHWCTGQTWLRPRETSWPLDPSVKDRPMCILPSGVTLRIGFWKVTPPYFPLIQCLEELKLHDYQRRWLDIWIRGEQGWWLQGIWSPRGWSNVTFGPDCFLGSLSQAPVDPEQLSKVILDSEIRRNCVGSSGNVFKILLAVPEPYNSAAQALSKLWWKSIKVHLRRSDGRDFKTVSVHNYRRGELHGVLFWP